VRTVKQKRGANGVLAGTLKNGQCQHWELEADKVDNILSVNGAGDSLDGGVIWGLLAGKDIKSCLQFGLKAAKLCLESENAVSPLVSQETIG